LRISVQALESKHVAGTDAMGLGDAIGIEHQRIAAASVCTASRVSLIRIDPKGKPRRAVE
jgi:hypothetical protein